MLDSLKAEGCVGDDDECGDGDDVKISMSQVFR